ncbi:DUF4142 domain-containing protein, partial [Acinetobacter baumannii]|nr:DUF4142 domain-containing protein [Acinetobacter baumannii]MDW5367336.1 DUF4142 domain-containing protein [Acinetobacter baumannii]MDW5382599.1 DUF4142 domain-containing protein [Acinetobacter baumannii]
FYLWLLHKYLKIRTTLPFVYLCNKAKSLQNDSDKIVSKLNQITSDTDKNYMMSQVKVHRKVLTIIDKQLIPNTKSSELKNMLVQTRDAVAKHLKAAEDIFKNMK